MSLTMDGIRLSELRWWGEPIAARAEAFAALRRDQPLSFWPEPENPFGPEGPGYYAVVRHADVVEASKRPELFCSGLGAAGILDQAEEVNEFFGSMINMDDPKHKRLRGIVSSEFTPRRLRLVEEMVSRAAVDIVDRIIDDGGCDFVTEVAARLPLKIICDMMGIPDSEYDFVFEQSNIILGASDPEFMPEGGDLATVVLNAGFELSQLVTALAEEREREPTDDLTSALVHAEVDGERLTHQELASFFILLAVAGNETTRNAVSWGLHLLTENPEQLAAWQADFEGLAPTAVDEIVRWASPVIYMRRTVTTDGARLGGAEFAKGDKLALIYWSANRDETVFDDPERFDVSRAPNYHVGFGAPGPHFCLGAHLARREITVMFRELFRRIPTIRATGEPDRLLSSFINGVKHLPCEW